MSRPRVLLVEDDESIRRFVAMALEDLDIELLSCASVAQALATLQAQGPVELVMTDLMMPGESGLSLLQRLADEPGLRAGARLVVFSAGLHGPVQAQLAGYDVWRQLPKPVSAGELLACVQGAVATAVSRRAPPVAPAAEVAMPAAAGALDASAAAAVAAHFGGDRALFVAFRAGCLAQFEADVARGEASHARGDLADLRHLAHSLKSVLTLLGEADPSEVASRLEAAAARADAGDAAALWPVLRDGLAAFLAHSRAG